MSKTETAFDLSRYLDSKISVKFIGGREIQGVLKGFDDAINLVLDECTEFARESADASSQRPLGFTVCRGCHISHIAPADDIRVISNPFESSEVEPDLAVET